MGAGDGVKIDRAWSMPSSDTFSIKPINCLIRSVMAEIGDDAVIVDPFARNHKLATVTNDIDPETSAMHHMDAMDFLKTLGDQSADLVLFDPPYSPRQVSEVYRKLDKTVNMKTTQASFWGSIKREIGRIVRHDGRCITFGWNSGGVGMKFGFSIYRILLVAHGGWHNDTICTVERKVSTQLRIFDPAE